MTVTLEVDLPGELDSLHLPAAVADRLQALLDRQDGGAVISDAEGTEAEGLVEMAEFLTLLRLRKQRIAP